MDTWEYVERGGDLASIYGVRQRQFILDGQYRSYALLEKQLELERARLKSEENLRAEEKAKLDNLKKARKTLCVIEGLVSALEARNSITGRDVANLAVAQRQFDFFSSKEVFETLEDIRALSSLQTKISGIEQKWLNTGVVNDSPLKLRVAYGKVDARSLLQKPMSRWTFFVGIFSRLRNASIAVLRSDGIISAQSTRTERDFGSSTRVIRRSSEQRANSTGSNGPSWNQPRVIGNVRGFQTNEPQPKHAIFMVRVLMPINGLILYVYESRPANFYQGLSSEQKSKNSLVHLPCPLPANAASNVPRRFSFCGQRRPTNLKQAALVYESRLRGLDLIYLTGVGGVAEPVPPAGGKLSDEAGQCDGLDEFDGANQPDSSGSSDEVPLE